ncbi:hypothetical protein ACXWRS_11065, partial [Streptococcus pyogenes]
MVNKQIRVINRFPLLSLLFPFLPSFPFFSPPPLLSFSLSFFFPLLPFFPSFSPFPSFLLLFFFFFLLPPF